LDRYGLTDLTRFTAPLPEPLARLVGRHPSIARVRREIARVAPTTHTVLIVGETGTGKELAARAIHALSGRPGPFVAVNVAAIPEGIFHAELFGHRRGAFTDASQDQPGLFEEASGGTIFLDEVGDLPLASQPALLGVLEEPHQVRRVGETTPRSVDVRIVAATNQDLEELVQSGRFLPELYNRLRGVTLRLPALRERGADILTLSEHFLKAYPFRDPASGQPLPRALGPEAASILSQRPWPGNVRELQRTIRRAALLTEGPVIPAEAVAKPVSFWDGVGGVCAHPVGVSGDGRALSRLQRPHGGHR